MYPSPLDGAISLAGWCSSYMSAAVSGQRALGEGRDVGKLGQGKCGGKRVAIPRVRFLGSYLPFDLTLLVTLPPSHNFPLPCPCPFPAILCYFNHKSFWSLILSHPSGAVSCSSSFGSAEESPRAQMITDTPTTQEGVLDPERKDTHL